MLLHESVSTQNLALSFLSGLPSSFFFLKIVSLYDSLRATKAESALKLWASCRDTFQVYKNCEFTIKIKKRGEGGIKIKGLIYSTSADHSTKVPCSSMKPFGIFLSTEVTRAFRWFLNLPAADGRDGAEKAKRRQRADI